MYLCIDFDGTIVDHRFPSIGEPVPMALDYIKRFQGLGALIILFTMRSDFQGRNVLTAAVDFLKNNGISLFGVNHNPDQHIWTSSPKAYGHVYVDDAAIGTPLAKPAGFVAPCVDWSIVGPTVLEKVRERT